MSRQTLSAIEAGESVPSTALALELGRVLGCRVEDIFSLPGHDEPPALTARVAAPIAPQVPAASGAARGRLLLGKIGARWVAHGMAGEADIGRAADATASPGNRRASVSVTPLRDLEDLELNVLVAGCDPALALLAWHVQDGGARVRLHWIEAPSGESLAALARNDVHIAGIHSSERGGNEAAVRRALAGRASRLVTLASWQEGLVVASGNPKRIGEVADLAKRGIRVLTRPRGSGAQALLERSLRSAKLSPKDLNVVGVGPGHLAAARTVAVGIADATLATQYAAETFGLCFLPLSEERFDLVVLDERSETAPVRRMLAVLAAAPFRRDLGTLPGYATSESGREMAVIAA